MSDGINAGADQFNELSDEEQRPDSNVVELKAAEDIEEGAAVAVNANGEAVNASQAEQAQQTETPEQAAQRAHANWQARARRIGGSAFSNISIREYIATHVLVSVIGNPLEGGNATRNGFHAPDVWCNAAVNFADRLLLELAK